MRALPLVAGVADGRFTFAAGFPDFSWDMRCIDLIDLRQLIAEVFQPDPQRLFDYKVATIPALMLRLPQRRFVLVGDSGERDAETYAEIVSGFAEWVDAVPFRKVEESQPAKRSCDTLFPTPAARAKLQVFDRPDELPRRLAVSR